MVGGRREGKMFQSFRMVLLQMREETVVKVSSHHNHGVEWYNTLC